VQTILDGLGRAAAGIVWLLAAVVGLVILVILSPFLFAARLFRRA
jgi:threonine/homoserine/homoserine lactone efflux protein